MSMGLRTSNVRELGVLDRLVTKAVSAVTALVIWFWCRTCRVKARINEHAERSAVKASNGAVYATWHQRMFYFFYDFGSRHVTMMISRSRDGDYANEVALKLGFLSVRGSSRKGGRNAMNELVERLNAGGHTAGMMADGPTGPPRVLKMGTVKIARETASPSSP
jgi:lysophospholipid acyltransferase (LPLAT)-like uncharacterized protein